MSPDYLHDPIFRYAVITDTHLRPGSESSSPWATNWLTNDRARWVLDRLSGSGVDLILHLGDIVHPVPHQPSYKSAAEVACSLFETLEAPIYLLPGNHDVGDKNNPNAPSFTVDEHGLDIYRRWFGPLYQSFDHCGIHFILLNSSILNSGLPEEDAQRLWLEADLEEHGEGRIHMFSHYPPFIVDPCEPSNYDNMDEPARSWLLSLLKEYKVEAFFAGHVHQYGYNAYGCTRIYNLLSTCFVRQDYSEMFHVEPTDEYGRNDTAKLGWCTVDVYGGRHRTYLHRSYGRTLGEGEPGEKQCRIEPRHHVGYEPSLGVHMRHAIAETMELPYNGPIDEFTRKTVRNDYPVLGLLETGIRWVRLPLEDLKSPLKRKRLKDLWDLGFRFGFFLVGPPTSSDLVCLHNHCDLVGFLEAIFPWEKVDEYLPQTLQVRDELKFPLFLANIESSVHREKGGPTFSHYISHGFNVEDKTPLEEFISRTGEGADGYTFQVGHNMSPWLQIMDVADYADRRGFTALINVRLSSENPAEYLADDNYVSNRAAESLVAAYVWPKARILMDTFMDLDRGYFPRHGLYDRRWNPRKAAHVLSNLKTILDREEGIKPMGLEKCEGCKVLSFNSKRSDYRLLLPEGKGYPDLSPLDIGQSTKVIDLVQGLVKKPESLNEVQNPILVETT